MLKSNHANAIDPHGFSSIAWFTNSILAFISAMYSTVSLAGCRDAGSATPGRVHARYVGVLL